MPARVVRPYSLRTIPQAWAVGKRRDLHHAALTDNDEAPRSLVRAVDQSHGEFFTEDEDGYSTSERPSLMAMVST